MTIVLTVNGQLGVGKTWFCDRVQELFNNTLRLGARDFIWREVQAKYKWTGSYELFKVTRHFDGLLGRDAMIEWAEYRRRQLHTYWVDEYMKAIKNVNATLIINDSLADQAEQSYFLYHDIHTITIVIAPHTIKVNDFYSDNYRRCVLPINGFRAENSDEALKKFNDRLRIPQSNPIWHKLHVARSMAWR